MGRGCELREEIGKENQVREKEREWVEKINMKVTEGVRGGYRGMCQHKEEKKGLCLRGKG